PDEGSSTFSAKLVFILTCMFASFVSVTWCVLSDTEEEKCLDFAGNVSKANIHFDLHCTQGTSKLDCLQKIKAGDADAITLDGGDIYTAGHCFGLEPVAGEAYTSLRVRYYAVAVAKTTPISLLNLSQKRSCHTGFGRTAGWVIPVGFLQESGQISVNDCNFIEAVGALFNQSCVPGAKDVAGSPSNLCEACIGDEDGNNVCANGPPERYSGYAGAFRCLVEDHGDVAFVRHSTVFENSNGNNMQPWALNLNASNFKLLCRDGSIASPTSYETCNLAIVPAHAVMTRANETSKVFEFLSSAQELFGPDGSSNNFKMFDSSSYKGKDLLFDDDTKKLIRISESYESWLGEDYMTILKDQCSGIK
uniref:Transferrin-like domain-containing protein n=1 Tax=Latimeria chalumnae TaxID=7897 RepID=H3BEV0_LATCH